MNINSTVYFSKANFMLTHISRCYKTFDSFITDAKTKVLQKAWCND